MEVLRLKRNERKQITNVVESIFSSAQKADEVTEKLNQSMRNRNRYAKRQLQMKKRLKKK